MKLLVVLALVACSKSKPPPPPAPVVAADAAAAPLVASSQVLTAIVPDWASTSAELRLWERERGRWKLVNGPWPGVVGANGTAWGTGVHGTGSPAGRAGPVKREGDGKSPAGLFAIRSTYGYAPSAKTDLPYQPVDESWKCIDDAKSAQYTKVLDARGVTKDWASAEEMRRGDDLYKWVIDIAHNPSATPGGGSCIFLHVWSGPKSATAGCTAMEEATLAQLIEQLDPKAMFVLLPRAEYDALAPAWGLP